MLNNIRITELFEKQQKLMKFLYHSYWNYTLNTDNNYYLNVFLNDTNNQLIL